MTGVKRNRKLLWPVAMVIVVFAATATYSQTFSVLYNLGSRSTDPAYPSWSGIVAQGRNGNLYSTTFGGGAHTYGAIFEASTAGKLRDLYSFCAQTNCTDGQYGASGLTLGFDGNFYGTTESGGASGNGTIFKITPNGTYTLLYSFPGNNAGGPIAPPILGPDGALYGTVLGLNGGCGTAYRITTTGTFTLLHQFGVQPGDECLPWGPLVLGTDGNFYGTTNGGATETQSFNGTFYRLTPNGKFTTLYSFDGTHGQWPMGALVQGSDGNFYGTAEFGGASGWGVVFKVTPTGAYTDLHDLNGTTDGGAPQAGLVLASDGNLYGTAGTFFQITPGGTYTVLHTFDGIDGNSPETPPMQHTNGIVYGETVYGGSGKLCKNNGRLDCGVIFSWDANLPPFVTFVMPRGAVGSTVEILGQGFTSSTTVSFNGVRAKVQVYSETFLEAMVPTGATTGFVTVTTSCGTLTSNRKFVVTP